MKQQVHNHTKEYSIAIMMHAISKAKFDGENQKAIAEFLGVDPTNIPKYKSGEQKLSINSIRLLIKKYGSPKVAAGKYMRAVCYSSIDDYLSSFEQRQADIFGQALTHFFKDPNILGYLAWAISRDVLKTNEELNAPYRLSFPGCGKNDVPAILDWLKKQCGESDFKQWYSIVKAAKPRVTDSHNNSCLSRVTGTEWSKARLNGSSLILLYLLAYYLDVVCLKFPFPNNDDYFKSKHLIKTEVVITGDDILAFESSTLAERHDYPFPSTNNQIIPLGSNHRYITNRTFDDEAIEEQITRLNKIKYVHANVTLYMNAKMEYRAVISENWGEQDHIVVIKNIPQDLLINEYLKLSVFYGIESNKEYELKEKIAIRGGFIAGTLLL
jgi:hypothetical protein